MKVTLTVKQLAAFNHFVSRVRAFRLFSVSAAHHAISKVPLGCAPARYVSNAQKDPTVKVAFVNATAVFRKLATMAFKTETKQTSTAVGIAGPAL